MASKCVNFHTFFFYLTTPPQGPIFYLTKSRVSVLLSVNMSSMFGLIQVWFVIWLTISRTQQSWSVFASTSLDCDPEASAFKVYDLYFLILTPALQYIENLMGLRYDNSPQESLESLATDCTGPLHWIICIEKEDFSWLFNVNVGTQIHFIRTNLVSQA